MAESVSDLSQKLQSTFGNYVYYLSPHTDVPGVVLSNDNRVFESGGVVKAEFWYYNNRPVVVPLDGYEDEGDQWKLTDGSYIRKVRPGQVTEG